ncbi:hypothetical protein B4119_1687 [Parageobacillus caldoxylosilyticus]|uniref:Uncharacterized protein n=1 Tax=Saccharococcus caldoxylosilyticus TaxID=81408 RepID=A0A150LLB5_9BACL|nr:hypothetical protein B4119_1687 [Parageobacillus caldoxylosilyticus]
MHSASLQSHTVTEKPVFAAKLARETASGLAPKIISRGFDWKQ